VHDQYQRHIGHPPAFPSRAAPAVQDRAGQRRGAGPCAGLHGWRCARWKGWRVADVPLVLVMHLGFAWLVLAFALKAAAELTGIVPEGAWLHAFTVGSLGLMMLGLMPRVCLRHTGRPLEVPDAMRVAWVLIFVAALLRLAATVHDLGSAVIALSAGFWAAAFAVYFMVFWKVLVTPSLPRGPQSGG
ncbi:MAG: NnrS family protein, partial [Betaproteobacteria bacterium]|nr:NnrS family protein [Betaproteobacteria bacterium]